MIRRKGGEETRKRFITYRDGHHFRGGIKKLVEKQRKKRALRGIQKGQFASNDYKSIEYKVAKGYRVVKGTERGTKRRILRKIGVVEVRRGG